MSNCDIIAGRLCQLIFITETKFDSDFYHGYHDYNCQDFKQKMNTFPFSLSEEAFLLDSLREVTKVWGRASGKASFNLSIEDGQANLHLGFQLGLPGDLHLPLPHHDPSPPKYKGSVRR